MSLSLPQQLIILILRGFLSVLSYLEFSLWLTKRNTIKIAVLGVLTFLALFIYSSNSRVYSLRQMYEGKNYVFMALGEKYGFLPRQYQPLSLAPDRPRLVKQLQVPEVSAVAALVVNTTNDQILFEKNSALRLPPASTTKLLTALVSMDIYDLDTKLTVPVFCTSVEGSKAYLVPNVEYSVNDLLGTMLVSSAADSACVLSTGKVSYEKFITLMNEKAIRIGMENSNFTNPIGLDDPNGKNYSAALDLYKLGKYSTQFDALNDIVKRADYTTANGLRVYTTNILLSTLDGSVGIKTGTTPGAGEVLLYRYKKDKADIVIVVLGSRNRFLDTSNLLNWAIQSYSWE